FAMGIGLGVVIVALALAGVAISLFEVWWQTVLALQVAPSRLARVASFDWLISQALLPFGYLLVIPISAAIGARAVVLVACLAATVALVLACAATSVR